MAKKLLFIALVCTTLTIQTSASELQECRKIESDVERLNCYDGLADQDKPQSAIQPSKTKNLAFEYTPKNETIARISPKVNADNEEKVPKDIAAFGGEQFRVKDKPVNSIETNLSGPLKEIRKDTILRLENGQIWKVVSSRRSRRFPQALESPSITITKGALSSHNLKIEGQRSSYKVKRLK